MQSPPALRHDFEAIKNWRRDNRTSDRILAHYVLECRLADQLRNASTQERPDVYGKVYDELYAALYDHPKRSNRRDPGDLKIERQIGHIAPYLASDGVFVELGCGDSALSLAVTSKVRSVIGIDVQDQLIDHARAPANYRFIRSTDGITIPLPTNSVDVVFSDQLMEHLHPDDAVVQLAEINRILKKSGVYICSTPSSLTGPHDISMYFDDVARGLHLKEYNYREMQKLFRAAKFAKIEFAIHTKFGRMPVPATLGVCLERIFQMLSPRTRGTLARTRIAERVFGINLVAAK